MMDAVDVLNERIANLKAERDELVDALQETLNYWHDIGVKPAWIIDKVQHLLDKYKE